MKWIKTFEELRNVTWNFDEPKEVITKEPKTKEEKEEKEEQEKEEKEKEEKPELSNVYVDKGGIIHIQNWKEY